MLERIRDDESGSAIMLEGVFGVTVCMIVLIFLLSFGFFLYQREVVSIVANQVAEEVAQSYKFRDVKDATALSDSDVKNLGHYRYLFSNASSLHSKNETKAQVLANSRLPETSLAKANGGGAKVEIERVTSDIGRCHYEITVSQKYTFLLGGALELIGLSENQMLESTVYVEGVDISHYVNMVKLTSWGMDELGGAFPLLKLVNTTIGLMSTVWGLFH